VISVRRIALSFWFLALSALVAHAQSVRWAPGDSGDPSEVQLVYENCSPEGDPQLPTIEGTTFVFTGTRSETSIINFNTSQSVILTYRVRSRRGGPVQIPAFAVETDKGRMQVAPYRGGTPAPSLESAATATLSSSSQGTVWAGEVFPLTYSLSVARRNFAQVASNIDWTAAPLVAEDWSKPEPIETTIGGEARIDFIYKARAYAKAPGKLTLEAARQLVNLQTGSVGFGLFQQPRLEQIVVTSNRPEFTVRPLPAGAPASFNGAVGQFALESKVVPSTAAVGEPITWTLSLNGTGNWPDISGLPSREVSKDFQVVQPQPKRTPAEGKLFDATLAEDVVLVPTRPGSYTLGPVTYSYFDPKTSRYVTLTTEKVSITVTAPQTPQFNITTPGATEGSVANGPSGKKEETPAVAPTPPGPPSAIPRDPLPGSEIAATPLSARALTWALLAPFGLLLVFWGALAFRRARATDPQLSRRAARARLSAILGRLPSADPETRVRLLHEWRRDAAELWEVEHAAPPPSAWADSAWAELCAELDQALYRPGAELSREWFTRAQAALVRKPVPSFSFWQLFHPRNLAPFFVIAVACITVVSARGDARSDYRKGDFAAAEKAWRDAVRQHPTDWIARHNLALALAQQDHWDEAAAHAAAAFVQHPDNPSVRWHLAPTFEKAAYTPTALAAFTPPTPISQLAQLVSPAQWQRLLVAASVLLAGALGLWLARAYGWSSRLVHPLAIVAVVFAFVLAASGLTALHAFGAAADARSVVAWRAGLLRSIPTVADTTQKTTALPAGSVALVDQTFLDWVHLRFENDQTGWARKEDIVPLWQ
jgi:tetratricopeptide (TPR) repeat protein